MAMEEEWAPRPGRRSAARHVLGGRVAPHGRAQRLPRSACCSARRGSRCRWSWSRWVRRRRCARSRPPGQPTWPTPSCAAAAASCPPPATRAQSEVLVRREAELADGHASFRYSGFITVSAHHRGRTGGGLRRRCSTRRARPVWSSAVSTAIRPAPTRTRCRWPAGWRDGDGARQFRSEFNPLVAGADDTILAADSPPITAHARMGGAHNPTCPFRPA